jgi:hypothetical protein
VLTPLMVPEGHVRWISLTTGLDFTDKGLLEVCSPFSITSLLHYISFLAQINTGRSLRDCFSWLLLQFAKLLSKNSVLALQFIILADDRLKFKEGKAEVEIDGKLERHRVLGQTLFGVRTIQHWLIRLYSILKEVSL